MFGTRILSSRTSSRAYMLADAATADSKIYFYWGNNAAKASTENLTVGKIYEATIENGTAKISDMSNSAVASNNSFTSQYTLTLFGTNQGTIDSGNTYVRIYYFKVYEDGALVRDFIPCYRKSDGEIGLYDKVEKKFYANSGTGVFLKGNDL